MGDRPIRHIRSRRRLVMRKATTPPVKTSEYPRSMRANLEAFADAAAGRAPYPVSHEDMIANISALKPSASRPRAAPW